MIFSNLLIIQKTHATSEVSSLSADLNPLYFEKKSTFIKVPSLVGLLLRVN